jgi:hypothetical protein
MKIQDQAYIAGIIDGEGCFQLSKSANGYRPSLQISNTRYTLIEYLKKHLKGSISKTHRNPKHRPIWRLHVNPNDLRNIIEEVAPFLVIKKQQAVLIKKALKINSTVCHHKGYEGSTNISQRPVLTSLYRQLRRLNKRGI